MHALITSHACAFGMLIFLHYYINLGSKLMMPSTSENLPKLVKFLFAHPGLFELASQNSIILTSFYQITDRPSTLWPGECALGSCLCSRSFSSSFSLALLYLSVFSRTFSLSSKLFIISPLFFPPAISLLYRLSLSLSLFCSHSSLLFRRFTLFLPLSSHILFAVRSRSIPFLHISHFLSLSFASCSTYSCLTFFLIFILYVFSLLNLIYSHLVSYVF